MNIREKLINDINRRAQVKLAGFAEMKPYLVNTLLGGATLSAFTALPALLHSYSNDEDPLKVLAEVTKYSMPIGALMGAGATGASRLSNAVLSAAENLGNKTLQAVSTLTSGTRDIANDTVNALAKSIGPVANTMTDIFKEIKESPADLLGLVTQ